MQGTRPPPHSTNLIFLNFSRDVSDWLNSSNTEGARKQPSNLTLSRRSSTRSTLTGRPTGGQTIVWWKYKAMTSEPRIPATCDLESVHETVWNKVDRYANDLHEMGVG